MKRRTFLKLIGYGGIAVSNINLASASTERIKNGVTGFTSVNGVITSTLTNSNMYPLALVKAESDTDCEMLFHIFSSVSKQPFKREYCQYLGSLLLAPKDRASVQINLPPESEINFYFEPDDVYKDVRLNISVNPYTYVINDDNTVTMTSI